MVFNFLKIAWRRFSRQKTHLFINVTGLALGLTCCLFILLWVRDEKNVDHFRDGGENVYSLFTTTKQSGKTDGIYSSPVQYDSNRIEFPTEDIAGKIPGVKAAVYYATGYELPWGHAETLQFREKKFKLNGARAGGDFFKLFPYQLLQGSAGAALPDKNNVAVSHKTANLLFGSPQNAMGKTLRYENKLDFIVSSVFEDLPENSSLQFDFLLNFEQMRTNELEWASNDAQQFIQLRDGADLKTTEARLNEILKSRLKGVTGVETTVGIQRFSDRYLFGRFVNGRPATGRIEYVRIFSGVAIFILLIACINFMNLTTAASVKRGREIGVRKVIGSSRYQLLGQFLTEAVMYAAMAMLASLALLFFLLPSFNQLTGKHIVIPGRSFAFWISLAGITLLTGLVAGSYPALYLSSLQPVRTLKGVVRFTQRSIWFRKSLTVFQFVLSVLLIICTIVISRQTSYVQTAALGYDRSNMLYIRIEGELSGRDKYLRFKHEAMQLPGVSQVDRSTEAPHSMDFLVDDAIHWEGQPKNVSVQFKPASVGFDFVKLMGLSLAEGRDFSPAFATDSTDAFLINETAVREMGIKDPIGKWVSAWAKKGHIVGILKDYHTGSLREPIKPVMLDIKENEYFGVIMVKIRPGQSRQALEGLAAIYKNINPNFAFASQFMDEEYQKLYTAEMVISRLSVLFSGLAIAISCLGLLGLVLFTTEQKLKEIGIRKVLGASVTQIFSLFSSEFLKPVAVAFIIAVPASLYFMHHWLQDFAYRVSLSWWIFALAGASVVLIALLTMSIQALKAARVNPVKSLRND